MRRKAAVVTQKPAGTRIPSIRDSSPRCAPLPPTTATCVSSTFCRPSTYCSVIAKPPRRQCSIAPAIPSAVRGHRVPRTSMTTHARRAPSSPSVLGPADDSAAKPGPCRKPPGALYVKSGKERNLLCLCLLSSAPGQQELIDSAGAGIAWHHGPMTDPSVRIRPYHERDRSDAMSLANGLEIGVAPWRDQAAVRSAVTGWIDRSLNESTAP